MLLAVAGFASQAQVRVTDSLLPQIASDFHTTVGVAAIVVTAYAVTHGTVQFVIGPVGDRFGKYRTVAVACAARRRPGRAVRRWSRSLPQLALARLATGAGAGWVIPISMAYIGDVTPHDRLQPILARYASGHILGQLFGQAAGGVLGDLFGWRNVFFVLGGMFALAAVGLVVELAINPRRRAPRAGRAVATRLRRRLCRRPVQSVRAHRPRRRLHRRRAGLGRLRLYRRRPASAFRLELHADRHRPSPASASAD